MNAPSQGNRWVGKFRNLIKPHLGRCLCPWQESWNYRIFKGSFQTKPFCDSIIQFYTLQKQETKQWSPLQQGLEFSPSGEKRGSHPTTCFLLLSLERCLPSHGSHVAKQLPCMENTALGVNGMTGGLMAFKARLYPLIQRCHQLQDCSSYSTTGSKLLELSLTYGSSPAKPWYDGWHGPQTLPAVHLS